MFNGHKTWTASVGAAMAYVIGQDMWLDALTVNHVPENPDEEERVEASGAEIRREAVLVGRHSPMSYFAKRAPRSIARMRVFMTLCVREPQGGLCGMKCRWLNFGGGRVVTPGGA